MKKIAFKVIFTSLFVLAALVLLPTGAKADNEATITINITNFGNYGSGADMSSNVYVGSSSTPYGAGSVTIPLTSGGVSIADPSSTDDVSGLHITRGNGFILISAYGADGVANVSKETVKATFSFANATISGAENQIGNGPYDSQGDGICKVIVGDPQHSDNENDEYTISGNSGTLCSTTSGGRDRVKIFYTPATSSCTPLHSTRQCYNGDAYWYDSCGNRQDLAQDCTASQTCVSGNCVDQTITCSTNSQCGTAGYINSPFCKNGDVYKTYRTYTCNNAGTANSYCSQSDEDRLQQNCTSDQTCSGGTCHDQDIACSSSSSCGTSGYIGSNFCKNGDVYKTYRTYTCNNAGTANSYCSQSDSDHLVTDCTSSQYCSNGSCTGQNCSSHSYQQCSGNYLYWYDSCGNREDSQYCSYGCSGNTCQNQNCTYHSYQQCSGNYLYWYDSCGNKQDVAQYCQNNCYNNSCQNYCYGNNCYNYNYSTVQSTQATNIANNQATLNGYLSATNANYQGYYSSCMTYVWFEWGTTTAYGNTTSQQGMDYNYTGAFSQNITGVYPGTTYHFRAAARNCSGSTVYGQDSSFYVYPQVLGATTISTGLTNSLWLDSFFLPLAAALIGLWMYKAGMFVRLEAWLAGRKKVHGNYKAERELNRRIAKIRNVKEA